MSNWKWRERKKIVWKYWLGTTLAKPSPLKPAVKLLSPSRESDFVSAKCFGNRMVCISQQAHKAEYQPGWTFGAPVQNGLTESGSKWAQVCESIKKNVRGMFSFSCTLGMQSKTDFSPYPWSLAEGYSLSRDTFGCYALPLLVFPICSYCDLWQRLIDHDDSDWNLGVITKNWKRKGSKMPSASRKYATPKRLVH